MMFGGRSLDVESDERQPQRTIESSGNAKRRISEIVYPCTRFRR